MWPILLGYTVLGPSRKILPRDLVTETEVSRYCARWESIKMFEEGTAVLQVLHRLDRVISLWTYARTHARTHAHTRTHAGKYARNAHAHTHTHARTHARTHVRTHAHARTQRTHTQTHTHTRARARAHGHIHTYEGVFRFLKIIIFKLLTLCPWVGLMFWCKGCSKFPSSVASHAMISFVVLFTAQMLFCCHLRRGGGGYVVDTSGNSSVVRAPDSWSKGRGFESLLEQRENSLLQGQLSVLTLISVYVPPKCYRSST